jgi:hypothetical protein
MEPEILAAGLNVEAQKGNLMKRLFAFLFSMLRRERKERELVRMLGYHCGLCGKWYTTDRYEPLWYWKLWAGHDWSMCPEGEGCREHAIRHNP